MQNQFVYEGVLLPWAGGRGEEERFFEELLVPCPNSNSNAILLRSMGHLCPLSQPVTSRGLGEDSQVSTWKELLELLHK